MHQLYTRDHTSPPVCFGSLLEERKQTKGFCRKPEKVSSFATTPKWLKVKTKNKKQKTKKNNRYLGEGVESKFVGEAVIKKYNINIFKKNEARKVMVCMRVCTQKYDFKEKACLGFWWICCRPCHSRAPRKRWWRRCRDAQNICARQRENKNNNNEHRVSESVTTECGFTIGYV